jgi:hypothetical protein
VLRNGGLSDAELALDDGGHVAGSAFAFGHQLQEPTSNRIAQNVERVHQPPV